MLIDKYGSIDYTVKGVITKNNNVILDNNQFLQWTPTGKRLELWEGKKEYFQLHNDDDVRIDIRRIRCWNDSSIYGFI